MKQEATVQLCVKGFLHIPGLAIATEEYGAKFFADGAAPGGVLEHPGTIKDPQKVKESWNSVYQGSSNAHRAAVPF